MTNKTLITGGAGFVGSSLAMGLKKKYPAYSIICFDNLKRRGSELNIPRLSDQEIKFIHGDIRNREDFDACDTDVTTLIEASAESSVLAGMNQSPDYLINTNLMGTVNCLYYAAKTKADFLFISTSRVYPIENLNRVLYSENESRFAISVQQELRGASAKGISEDFPMEGFRSLYGATKLSSEFLIREFTQFYNIRAVINRCGVITGPWQMGKVDQGVIVLWVARHYWKKELGYFGYGGKGKQVRDILHIHDLFRLIDFQIHDMENQNGRLYNVGGGREISVSLKELTSICEKVTGNKVRIAEIKEERQVDVRIYVSDNSAVTSRTGWHPGISVERIVIDIFEWIRNNEQILKRILIP